MAITDYKITADDIAKYGCVALPDTLTGSAQENKKKFDRLVRECVANAVNAVIDNMASIEQSAAEWETEEEERKANETARIAAETARETAESARETAEAQRALNEGTRKAAESTRAATENARVSAESARVSAENARVTAEQGRVTAETSRKMAEAARELAEENREAQESARAFWATYSASTSYAVGNKVYYQGSSYICKTACKGIVPTNTTYWQIIAQKGADGTGGGDGDMLASVYDPQGRKTDVFAYADNLSEALSEQVEANTAARHTHDNKTVLDAITGLSTSSSLTYLETDAYVPSVPAAIAIANTYAAQVKAKAHKVTLTVAGWSSSTLQQTVSCTGVSSSETAQIILPMPAAASRTAYVDAGVMCVAQASGKLTFQCDEVPSAALTVYIGLIPVTYS